MVDSLTPENFILHIKQMDTRERKKITAQRFLELILAKADSEDNRLHDLENKISDLYVRHEESKQGIFKNSVDIRCISETIPQIRESSNSNNNNEIAEIHKKLADMQKELFDIEQYLRVNNVEVVGLPLPVAENDESYESILLGALNTLVDLNFQLTW